MKPKMQFPIIIAVVLFLAGITIVNAAPPLPSSFWGRVLIDSANVPDGTEVTVWINGVQYARTTTLTWSGDSVYTLDVPGDDLSTPDKIEGGVEGDTIVFKIAGFDAVQMGVWHSGTNIELNLSRPAAPQAPDVVISESGDSPQLSWPHISDHYEVWRSSSPYFAPGAPATLLDTLTPCSTPVIYLDSTVESGVNAYYIVRAFNATHAWSDSDVSGRFVFSLVPGN